MPSLRAGTAACHSTRCFWLRSGAPPARSTRHTICKRASEPATGPAARQFCWLAALLEALSKKGARRGLLACATPAHEISETVRRCLVWSSKGPRLATLRERLRAARHSTKTQRLPRFDPLARFHDVARCPSRLSCSVPWLGLSLTPTSRGLASSPQTVVAAPTTAPSSP